MAKQIPVYSIERFNSSLFANAFYCNRFSLHVREHQFTNLPHKHNFYLTVIITKGQGWHEIDFVRYKVKTGTVFLMQPGQMHYWQLSKDIEGYVFFHTGHFYNQHNVSSLMDSFSFFKSVMAKPQLVVPQKKLSTLVLRAKELLAEYQAPSRFAAEKITAVLKLIYLELSENYEDHHLLHPKSYLSTLQAFEQLIENQFLYQKSVGHYANELAVSTKHLNRITKTCLNKTATELITERIVLEAKRLLLQSTTNINQIAMYLGFEDTSYFIRLFKKHSASTPRAFIFQQTKTAGSQLNRNH